jgi:hypothetical protein
MMEQLRPIFFCFDSVAKRIVGKPCEALLRTMDVSGNAPVELTGIVGLKFTFAINININSFYKMGKIFNIDSILEAHGRQDPVPTGQQIAKYQNPLIADEHVPSPIAQNSPVTPIQKNSARCFNFFGKRYKRL